MAPLPLTKTRKKKITTSFAIKLLKQTGLSNISTRIAIIAIVFAVSNAHAQNVGIGTNTPGKKLDVNGTARVVDHIIFNSSNGVINWGSTGSLYFRTNATMGDESSYTERMILSNQGFLGINTGIPASPLQIDEPYSVGTPILNLRQTTGSWGSAAIFNSYRYIQTNYTGPALEFKQFNVGAGGLSIGYSTVPTYNSIDALYVNGNVGIGTSTPSSLLHVAGKVRISDLSQGINRIFTSDVDGVGTWMSGKPAAAFYNTSAFNVPVGATQSYSSNSPPIFGIQTVTHNFAGNWTITTYANLGSNPTILCTIGGDNLGFITYSQLSSTQFLVKIYNTSGTLVNYPFSFVAFGYYSNF